MLSKIRGIVGLCVFWRLRRAPAVTVTAAYSRGHRGTSRLPIPAAEPRRLERRVHALGGPAGLDGRIRVEVLGQIVELLGGQLEHDLACAHDLVFEWKRRLAA